MVMLATRTASFVIRLWLEDGDTDPRWRWHAWHVQTGEEHYFTRFEDLLKFIGEHSDGLTPP